MSDPISGPDKFRPKRGAIVVFDENAQQPQSIYFQFNPATLSRQVVTRAVGGETGGHSEAVRLLGSPEETLSIELEFDALNALPNAQQAEAAVSLGVFPQLSALEVIVQPSVAAVNKVTQQLSQGTLQVAPYTLPLVLLSLGPNRVVPIEPVSYQIIEQQFDELLNPIRATVTLQARVLSNADLVSTAPAYQYYQTFAKHREQMAASARVRGAPGISAP